MNITNKTKRPIKVPLPGGKNLFLGPGKTGQITTKTAEHPPLVELIEAGDIETDESNCGQKSSSSNPHPGPSKGQGGGSSANIRRTGDR